MSELRSDSGALPLRELLAKVSRSFYLSLRVLPRQTRSTVALAYLLARAADTVADTRIVAPTRRRALLSELSAACAGSLSLEARQRVMSELAALELSDDAIKEEGALLRELSVCLDALDRLPAAEAILVRRVLETLTEGMAADLERFDPDPARAEAEIAEPALRALETRDELLHYCYQVAGCVGEFWSQIHALRLPRVRSSARAAPTLWLARGVQLGRALQLTNVLRDVRRDLEHGRCYLPRQELSVLGLAPRDLLDAEAWPRLRPLYESLVRQALSDAAAGVRYTQSLPAGERTLRLAGFLPLSLAVRTLGEVLRGNPLAAPAKVSRRVVYRSLAGALWASRSEQGLAERFRADVRAAGLRALAPPLGRLAPPGTRRRESRARPWRRSG